MLVILNITITIAPSNAFFIGTSDQTPIFA